MPRRRPPPRCWRPGSSARRHTRERASSLDATTSPARAWPRRSGHWSTPGGGWRPRGSCTGKRGTSALGHERGRLVRSGGEIDFDGIPATLPELLRALRRGDTMVVLGDGSFGMLPEEWLKKYAPLAEMGAVEGDRLRFRPAQAGLLDALLMSQPEASVDALFAKARDSFASSPASSRRRRRERFAESCALTRRPASAGSPSCAGSDSAGAWPMTWAWARRSRSWRCWRGGRAESAPFDCGGAEVAGLELGAGDGALRTEAAHPHPRRPRARGERDRPPAPASPAPTCC